MHVSWLIIESYTLPGTVRATICPCSQPWCPEFESFRMLTVCTPPVLSYYSDLVHRHQQGQSLVSSIAVVKFTGLTVFRFLGSCCDGTVGVQVSRYMYVS